MKLLSKASLAFKKENPSEKVSFGTTVINALILMLGLKTKNTKADPPGIPVPVADLQSINEKLLAGIAAAKTGNHQSVAALKNINSAWNIEFTLVANWVTSIADGDPESIRSYGFIPTKTESQPKQKPAVAATFKATINGSSGAIIAGAKAAVPNAVAHLFSAATKGVSISYDGDIMIISVGEEKVYLTVNTQKQVEMCNLSKGVPVNVSMYSINSAGSGPAASTQQVIPQ